MTEQHPLFDLETDEVIQVISHNIRAVADWQLEQVIEWLNDNLACSTYLQSKGYYDCEIDVDDVLDDLKEAMRPTQQENN